MNEEAAFIAALAADPSDRTAALVFADWLDERSDPRGPMLRIDEVRARLAPKYENPLPALRAALETGKGVKKAGEMYALIGETAVPELVSFLTHETPIVRLRAVQVLSRMGEKAKSSVPALLELVKNSNKDDVRARREAVRLLGAMRMKEAAKDEYAKGLDSSDAAERLTAVEAMVKMGLRSKSAGSALSKALTDESDSVRRAAVQHFRYIAAPSMPFAVEPLRKALSDKDTEIRTFAAIALGKIGPKATAAVPDLLSLANAAEKQERKIALEALDQLGVRSPELLTAVLAALKDPDARLFALGMLSKWPALPPSATPAILELVRRPNSGDRNWDGPRISFGLPALVRITPRPPEVLEELRAQLATDNVHTAARVVMEIGLPATSLLPDMLAALHRRGSKLYPAIDLIAAIGQFGSEGIAALVQLLDGEPSENNPVPALAAGELCKDGATARSVLPALLALLTRYRRTKVKNCRMYVVHALAAIGSEAAVAVSDVVAMLLEETEHYQFRSLSEALPAFGPAVLPFVPRLAEILHQPVRRGVHESIVRLILALLPHGLDAIPLLRDVLRQAAASYDNVTGYSSSNAHWLQVVREAVGGLTKLGPGAEAAVPEMVLVGQTFRYGLARHDVLTAFGKIGGTAIPHLRAALNDPDNGIRSAAISALDETGDQSAETRDALRELETDPNEQTRAHAASLLRKITTNTTPQ